MKLRVQIFKMMIFLVAAITVSTFLSPLALAQTPTARTQPVRPRHHLPQRRPPATGSNVNQQRVVRNHVTAPLGMSPYSVPNDAVVIEGIKSAMAYTNPAPGSNVAPNANSSTDILHPH